MTAEELLSRCEAERRFWLRFAVTLEDAAWKIRLFEAVSYGPPPSWQRLQWKYPKALFAAIDLTGIDLAEALANERIELGGETLKLPTLGAGQLWARRIPSRQHYVYEPLDWPTDTVEFGDATVSTQAAEPLIASDAPSFLTFAQASSRFFSAGYARTSSFSAARPAVRFQDPSGRILDYSVRPTEIEVSIDGQRLDGAVIELAGPTPGPSEWLGPRPRGVQRITLPIASELEPEAWLVLKHGSELLDERTLVSAFGVAEESATSGDPVSTVRSLIATGESSKVEFKSVVPRDRDERRNVARTIAAFANGDGGWLLMGVDDSGEVVGIRAEEATGAGMDTVTRWISDWVVPLPEFTIELAQVGDGASETVVIVTVKAGGTPPYGIEPARQTYWIRRNGTTFSASVDEVRRLVRMGDAQNIGGAPGLYPGA